VQRPRGHRVPGGRRGDDWHHHSGPDLLHRRGDPVGPPLRSHSNGGGGLVLRRLLQVRQHSQGDINVIVIVGIAYLIVVYAPFYSPDADIYLKTLILKVSHFQLTN